MPLQGDAKKDYQREYMRKKRGSNKGLTGSNKTSVRPIPGLIMSGNRILGVTKPVISAPIKDSDADGNSIPDYY